jgi:hypothetical protein
MDNYSKDERFEDNTKNLMLIASGQKLAIYSIILNFVVSAYGKGHETSDSAVFLGIFVSVLSVIGIWKMAKGQQLPVIIQVFLLTPCFVAVLSSIIPLFSSSVMLFLPMLLAVIILITLSIRSTSILRNAGYEVGFGGVKM